MNILSNNKKKKYFFSRILRLCVLMAAVICCAVYLNDYYRADYTAIDAFMPEYKVSKQVNDEHTIIYAPQNANTGFIFYPGGKVEATAYEPLMEALASKGILCVLLEMPFHLAVFDVNAADGIQEQFPNITNWYIGGHSLGGAMASSYLSKNEASFHGLVLLGAYSTADLSSASLKALSIYGSEDQVLNREKYDKYKTNLPKGFTEVVIEGGCHAYFGMYGAQDGDGMPVISNEEQIVLTANAVQNFIEK